ncbi:hypothetical protein VPDG_00137 [Vibrio phage henriette 12B8]|uniref:head maturation protease n=1 Tax=Vibrio phage henriette 12B8 TaxID=573174 RepID=UPI0002C144C6|nr:head maturation protease [Vibrio phage henriette 12B8]AGG58298.1 hypothetical protein VPDG_00137 [Vibrio phage henriette 12B8]
MIGNKQLEFNCTKVKALDTDSGTFSAYGNVTGVIDHAGDVTVKGAFENTIKKHKKNDTMPKFLGQHQGRMMPLGIITDIKEDENGLLFEGKFCLETQAGAEAYALCKMGAIDQFSIGYITVKESFDKAKNINYLQEVDVKEISLVTFACNEASTLQSIKSLDGDDTELTDRMIQDMLRENGISKRKAEKLVNQYKASNVPEEIDVKTITDFRQKMDTTDTRTHIKTTEGELNVKEMGSLSFSQIDWAISDQLVNNIGHRDFWVSDIFDGYGYVEYWDYINRDIKAAKFNWAVSEDVVTVSDFTVGDFTFSYDFVAEEIEEELDEESEENDEKGLDEEPKESVSDLLAKEDLSDWFTK